METLIVIQFINAGLLLAVLPFSISVLRSLLNSKVNHDNRVRDILILVFTSITLAAILSLTLYVFQLVGYTDRTGITIIANIRNLIKNFSFFITSVGFWMIEKNR